MSSSLLRFLPLLAFLLPAPAAAHPHVLVDARTELVFAADGRIEAVRHVWRFDYDFTLYAVEDLDTDAEGRVTEAELRALAQVNMESLAEFGFFTRLEGRDGAARFAPPREYWLQFHDERLTLFFTLPLSEPLAVPGDSRLEVFDRDYFVAFTFVEDDPVVLDGAPAGCAAALKPPPPPDTALMMMLNAIPADQPELPDALADWAGALATDITLTCP